MEDYAGGYFTEDDDHDVVELDNVLNVDDAVEHVGAQLAKEPQLDNTKHRTQFQHDHIEF